MDFVDFIINSGISAFLLALKNNKRKAQFKAIALKIYRAVKAAFPAETAAIDAGEA